jgi:integrase
MTDLIPQNPDINNLSQYDDYKKHPVAVYLANLGQGSRPTMLTALHNIARIVSEGQFTAWDFEWEKLEYQYTALIRATLIEATDFAPATINRHLSALRGVLKECWRLKMIDSETYFRAVDIQSIKGQRLPKGRMLTVDEIRAMLQVCDLDAAKSRSAGFRDAALLSVLYIAGMRRNELIHLKKADFDVRTGELKIRVAKRNKERLVYILGRARDRVIDWLNHLQDFRESDWLFVSIDQLGNPSDERIKSGQTVNDILQRRARQSAIKDFTPHDLRRTAISEMLDAGIDMATVGNIAGHANVNTTQRYDRRDDKRKEDAAKKRDVPL